MLTFTGVGLGSGRRFLWIRPLPGHWGEIRQKTPPGAVLAVAKFQATLPKLSDYVLGNWPMVNDESA
ncbi:MAG: hypothetical protein LBE17_01675 [Treponema sp.]|jgi:hypothetical protein|nr:hypothetical protein [Treponema sp.]